MASLDVLYEGYVEGREDCDVVRNTVCLVRDQGIIMVVDPGLVESPTRLTDSLAEYGLKPDDVTHVYVTHYHMDHVRYVGLFQRATIVDAQYTYSGEQWADHDGDGYRISNDIEIMHTPGHTREDSALLVRTRDGVIAISHVWWFPDRTPVEDPMAEDQEALEVSRKKVEAAADWIVTPHGGLLKVK